MIIKHLTNTDIYKFYMQQFFFYNYPDAHGIYKFQCRNGINLNFLYDDLIKEIDHLCSLRFKPFEIGYMREMKFENGDSIFREDYLNFLNNFKFSRDDIHIYKTSDGLKIFTSGKIIDTTHYEIFILKIIQELYWKNVFKIDYNYILTNGVDILNKKINLYKQYKKLNNVDLNIIEFGGRRAFSTEWHDYVTKQLYYHNIIKGTSDLYLGIKYNIPVKGTMAHEYVTFFQGIYPFTMEYTQQTALTNWLRFYKGNLGIALSDTLGDAKFDSDFDWFLSNKYQGCRQDSGNPILWGHNRIDQYKKCGINLKDKILFFSDNLKPHNVFKITEEFKDIINVGFGVGTNFTNDMGILPHGIKKLNPLQNVMKLVDVNGNPVAKLSNDIGKCIGMYDEKHLQKLRSVVQWI